MLLTALADDDGRRLDRILRRALPDLPLSALYRLLRRGLVLVNGSPGRGADRIPKGAVISVPGPDKGPDAGCNATCNTGLAGAFLAGEPDAGLDILWEGAGLLALNKPAGIAVHGNGFEDAPHAQNLAGQAAAFLAGRLPPSLSFRPGPLHRLDRNTSGVLVFSTNLDGARRFSALLKEGKIRKRYLAVLDGVLAHSEVWEDCLFRDKAARKTVRGAGVSARKAITRVRPVKTAGTGRAAKTLAELEIETGFTHQIRAQAALHGHPLGGDRKYGGIPSGYGSYFLHAAELEFPEDEALPRIIRAPLPAAFERALGKFFKDR